MGTSGNRDCQWASRRVLKYFIEEALTISAGSLFQNGTARIVRGELVKARKASLLVELIGVTAQPFAGWMCEDGRHGEFQEIMGNLGTHGFAGV